MTVNLFDIFGIGPSSSHTVGLMIAARRSLFNPFSLLSERGVLELLGEYPLLFSLKEALGFHPNDDFYCLRPVSKTDPGHKDTSLAGLALNIIEY